MTLADEARTLRERVAARLAELEPLVREYQELQRVADEIGLTPSEPASTTSDEPAAPAAAALPTAEHAGEEQQPRRPSARRRQPGRGQSRVAAAAKRDARLLEAVSAHPGTTVAEIATALGVDAVSLYRPVRDLASTGQVVKRGRGLFPASD